MPYVIGSEKTTLMAHGYIIEYQWLTANYIILSTSGFSRIFILPSIVYRL